MTFSPVQQKLYTVNGDLYRKLRCDGNNATRSVGRNEYTWIEVGLINKIYK